MKWNPREVDNRPAGQNFPTCYGKRRFITVFTKTHYWAL